MKIAYILNPNAIISGDSDGIKSQAISWREGLEEQGHRIDKMEVWGNYNWKDYDIIHIFGAGLWLHSFVKSISKRNSHIVISPIIDTYRSPILNKLSTFWGYRHLRLWSPTYTLKESLSFIKAVFVRSVFESKFFSGSMKYHKSNIYNVPLSINVPIPAQTFEKERICLHVSSITHKRKNVIKLIKAAKKYGFRLVLAGSIEPEIDFMRLKKEIDNANNIDVLGFVSKERLIELYTKAKVFALPSILEGVGIVGLEAAAYGCEIVITEIGGPKEYYNNMAHLVDPYDIDDIGSTVMKALTTNGFQPKLQQHIAEKFTKEKVSKLLEAAYKEILG